MPADLVEDIHNNTNAAPCPGPFGSEHPSVDVLNDAFDSDEVPEQVWCPQCWKSFETFEALSSHLWTKRDCLTFLPEDTVAHLSRRVGWQLAGDADKPPPAKRPRSDNAPSSCRPAASSSHSTVRLAERHYEGPRDAEEHWVCEHALDVFRRTRRMVSPPRRPMLVEQA